MNNEPEMLKMKTRHDEIKNLKYQTEKHKHDPENLLHSFKIVNEYCKTKYKNLNTKKILLIITEILIESGSATRTSTMELINPGAGIISSSSTALLTCIAILNTNEYISKLQELLWLMKKLMKKKLRN